MTTVFGIDFDNTIINYEEIFYFRALEKKLIPKTIERRKLAVREFLRSKKLEDEWTKLQGEVYGSYILEAKPFLGVLEAFKIFVKNNIPFYIISHKTMFPYLGDKINLHNAAKNWLKVNGFFNLIKENNVYFETSIEKKINRICKCGCTHFIDDLSDILSLLPSNINKIYFNDNDCNINVDFVTMKSWLEINDIYKK